MPQHPYRIFVIVLLVVLTVPRMTQRGMFGDGLLYAAVARNLSAGVGSFWSPTYTVTTDPEFFEQPPLGFGLQATAFHLFGEHPAVERVYSLLFFALQAFVITRLWRRFQPAAEDWTPLLFWILPSIVTWGVVNNMLENTQSLFSTGAILLIVFAVEATSTSSTVLWSGAGGLAIAAAVLTKGPVGLFPLAAPALLLVTRRGVGRRSALIAGVTMGGVLGFIAGALWIYPPSHHALSAYWQTQLIPSLEGKREINGDPLAVVRHLGLGIVARMAIISALCWLATWRQRGLARVSWNLVALFLGIALSASLPIGVSPKLVGHYFLPSAPFFALGFAVLTRPPLERLARASNSWARRVPLVLAVGLATAALVVIATRGSIDRRDTSLLSDLNVLSPVMPRNLVIGTCRASGTDWRLHSYVSRYYGVSLDAVDQPVNAWLLQVDRGCTPPPTCEPARSGESLALFRCNTQAPRN